jgi:2'-5' RNA ligase
VWNPIFQRNNPFAYLTTEADPPAQRLLNIIGPMAISAFAVQVPSAEPFVGDLRERFDATTKLGVPAHITVLVPFMDPQHITPAVLDRAQHALNRVAAFSFSLGRVARFPATAYLAPEPPEPFIAMTKALVDVFSDFQPYGGEHQGVVVPHLTVAHGDPSDAVAVAAELQRRLDASGAIKADCASVVLIENSTGRWEELHVFQLVSADT